MLCSYNRTNCCKQRFALIHSNLKAALLGSVDCFIERKVFILDEVPKIDKEKTKHIILKPSLLRSNMKQASFPQPSQLQTVHPRLLAARLHASDGYCTEHQAPGSFARATRDKPCCSFSYPLTSID